MTKTVLKYIEMKDTIIILISTTEKWLRLSIKERQEFSEQVLGQILFKYKETLKVKMYDSESFNAKNGRYLK
jgi:hypothetical protein